MSTIPIQIVDDKDHAIGEANSKTAWKEGLIHRIARVMIENPQGELLLQKRADDKYLWPGCWDNSAAGHVDAGEDYETAAKRETFEEVGLKANKLQELGTYYTDATYKEYRLRRFNRVYKVITEEELSDVSNDEVSEVRWFTVSEVKKLIKDNPNQVTDGLRDAIERYY